MASSLSKERKEHMLGVTEKIIPLRTYKGGFIITFDKQGQERTIAILLDRLLDNGFYIEGMSATCSLEEIEFTAYGATLKNPTIFFHGDHLEKITKRDGTILWSKS